MKKSIVDFRRMALAGEKVTWLTGYDYLTAKYEEKAGVDMILVGDSYGNVCLGYGDTTPVTMEEMVSACKAVRRGAPNTFVVGDMPYLSYQVCNEDAIRNAGRLTKEGGCDAVKLEGGSEEICRRITAVSSIGILVFGHIGLTPQFSAQMGGLKAQGRSTAAARKLVEEALRIEAAGACALLVEGVPSVVAKTIKRKLSIPVYGIGAGPFTDGQLLIFADMVGYYDDFTPKFVKQYAQIGPAMQKAFEEYCADVRTGNFPVDGEHTYKISAEDAAEIEKM